MKKVIALLSVCSFITLASYANEPVKAEPVKEQAAAVATAADADAPAAKAGCDKSKAEAKGCCSKSASAKKSCTPEEKKACAGHGEKAKASTEKAEDGTVK